MTIGVAYQEYSRRGGIERASAEIADRVAASGVPVHFHATTWEPSELMHFHRVRVPAWPRSLGLAAFAVRARAQLGQRYDVTHSYGSVVGCDVLTAQSCHRAGLTAAAGVHGLPGERANFGIADRVRLAIEKANFGRRQYRKVIAVSRGVRDELTRLYGVPATDIRVIPNGVDLRAFADSRVIPERRGFRERLGIADADPVLLFVGNEFRRKNLSVLITALAQAGLRKASLLVAGGDRPEPYRALASRLGVGDRIRFLGARTDMPLVYASADVFVLPSSYEALSLAMVEAAASGLPLFMTRVHGATEFIRPGENGEFIESSAGSLASSLSGIVSDAERRKKMGAAARECARSYSWDEIARQVLDVYREVSGLRKKQERSS